MASADEPALLSIEVVYSPAAEQADRVLLSLPGGCTVQSALASSGLLERHGLAIERLKVGVWGRQVAVAQRLRDRDRVEIYRPLVVDPKEARRLRYKGQRRR